jgi:hypothetical protein
MSVEIVLAIVVLLSLFVPLVLAPVLLADRDAESLVQLPD